MEVEVLEELLPLPKVPAYLRGLSLDNAPPVITVEFKDSKVTYLLQEDGYLGVITSQKGRRLGLSQYVSLRGDTAGWVTPPGAANILAQEKFEERDLVTENQYKAVLRRVLSTIIQALVDTDEGDEIEEEDIGKLLAAPRWLTFRKVTCEGEAISESDTQDYSAVGLEAGLLEFCEVAGYRIDIDFKKLLQSQVNKRYIRVEEGPWDEHSKRNARHANLRVGVELLAKREGYRLANRHKKS